MIYRLRRIYKAVGSNAIMLWHACRHPATSPLVKVGAILLAAYIISPIDLIPEALPVFGLLDDITLFSLGVTGLMKLVPVHVIDEVRAANARRPGKWKIFTRKN